MAYSPQAKMDKYGILATMKRVRNEKLLQAFGYQVRKIRMAKNMTLEGLADSAGIEYSQVIRVEAGKVNATISTIDAIAKGLGVPLSELMAFERYGI